MPMEIYLVRHGQSTLPGAYVGATDVPLSGTGIVQSKAAGRVIRTQTFDRCYCSPMIRCRETLKHLDVVSESMFIEELREIDFGLWEGKTFEQIQDEDPLLLELWHREKEQFRFPEGETVGAFKGRVSSWFARLLLTADAKVLVVTHAGVIRCAICHLLGLAFDQGFHFSIGEASVAHIVHEDGYGILAGLYNGGMNHG